MYYLQEVNTAFKKIVNKPWFVFLRYRIISLCSDTQLNISVTIIQKILRTNNKYDQYIAPAIQKVKKRDII